jgi:hypothetical protein
VSLLAEHFVIKLPSDVNDSYWPMDGHIGDLFLVESAVQEAINYMNRNPEGLLVWLGDMGRYFTMDERYMTFDEITGSKYPTPASQFSEVERIVSEVDHKKEWSFIADGNHELKIFKKAGNFYEDRVTGDGICKPPRTAKHSTPTHISRVHCPGSVGGRTPMPRYGSGTA